MSLLEKVIFSAAHEIQRPGFHRVYESMMRNQWKSRGGLLHEQSVLLRRMVSFCFERVPFYRRRFKEAGLTPSDIRKQSDLEKIPPVNKEDIVSNKADFLPLGQRVKSTEYHTGGTTGTWLVYSIPRDDRFLSGALLYRAWSGGGYRLGDRMMVLGGTSLIQNTRSVTKRKANEFTRNIRLCSAFKMGSEDMRRYARILNSWKPAFIRGYPSALKEFADFIETEGITVRRPKAVFATSEKLYPQVRSRIEDVLNARVFDTYGANDGGVSASERECGNLHVDTERSILEVVNEDNCQIASGKGRVLATSLMNFAMPFLRYDLGDEVIATDEQCTCGRGLPMLKEVIGRTVSVLVTPDGTRIHGWFLYHNWEFGESVKQFKMIQEDEKRIKIYLVPGVGFGPHVVERIRALVHATCNDWELDCRVVDSIPKSRTGKVTFIESKVKAR